MERMTRGGLVAVMLTAAMTCLPGTAAGAAPPGGADPAAAAALSGASSGAQRALAPGAAADKPLWRQSRDYWTTLAAPRIPADAGDGKPGARARPDWFQAAVARHHTGFPPAARELARREAIANRTGRSPRAVARRSGAAAVQQARLLTLLVEFNPNANDDFSGWERPTTLPYPVGCVTEPPGTTFSGPLHNELPNPATEGTGRDNNTFWVPDFTPAHYNRLIYSEGGLRQPVRPDLNGGVDLRRRTMRNFYLEMSKGAYEITARHPMAPAAALGGLVHGRHVRGRPGERHRTPGQSPRSWPDGSRCSRGARGRRAGVPVDGLRRRGPSGSGRRREPL